MFRNIDLETQYKGFNLCFWSMTILAVLTALFGNSIVAVLLGTMGLVSGAIGQLKLVLINQEVFLSRQVVINDKVTKLLGDK